ncbi:MAG: glycosyltransferase family 2 protein [Bacteroidales bacterium]|jgi:glycosyltransferase involved in cell wall biosynthesis
MLSVLIPVYNFDIRDLAGELSRQAVELKIPFEILVIDDKSDAAFRELNNGIAGYEGVTYHEVQENLGRSRIRNKLADMARFDNFLFLDCDSSVDNDGFLAGYVEHIGENNVIYGGRKYDDRRPERDKYLLHWLHGTKREQISVRIREHDPNRSFMTNNFLITRKAFEKVRFNEKMRGYGHEDTLFGYDLHKSDITIKHIDNPVIHLGLESSEEFLRKTREGIKNLLRIIRINGNEKKLARDITLLSYYKKIKKLKLDGMVRYLYSKTEYLLRRNLLSDHPKLFYFDLYKLGYLCSLNGEIK